LTLNDESAATECTCDYGDGCKHGAALLLELRKHAVEVKSAKAVVSAGVMPSRESLAGFVSAKLAKPLTI
jgi:uncharacterized Zn finger protein